jgi:hypothetical protein
VNTLNSRCLDNAWITKKVMVTKLRNIWAAFRDLEKMGSLKSNSSCQ